MRVSLAGLLAGSLALGAACGATRTVASSPSDGGLNASFDPGFTPTSPNKPGSIQVTFSGESFGESGLPYPGNVGDPFFVDGWSLTVDEWLVVVANIRLTGNASQYADQSQLNAVVAQRPGPYVFDAHQPSGFVGEDGVEPAGGIFRWDTQDNGEAFDTSLQYAFSYDIAQARLPATQVNLTADQFADYDQMVAHGWTKLLKGTATYAGSTPTGAFATFPTAIHFSFGWDDHGSVINCLNPDLGATDQDQPSARGIRASPNGAVYAQITAHLDHLFWDKLEQEGTPLRFDPVAAWAPPASADASTPLTLDDLDHSRVATFADGTPLPDRAPQVTPGFVSDQPDPTQVILALNGVPARDVANLADFLAFSAQSQMHLNADGLCYITGQHAPDPYYSPGLPR